eukprot:COSAG06_NODE_50058_length_321_cov_0.698198_1_plen_56_part_10
MSLISLCTHGSKCAWQAGRLAGWQAGWLAGRQEKTRGDDPLRSHLEPVVVGHRHVR